MSFDAELSLKIDRAVIRFETSRWPGRLFWGLVLRRLERKI